jgi:hypothetical protein
VITELAPPRSLPHREDLFALLTMKESEDFPRLVMEELPAFGWVAQ